MRDFLEAAAGILIAFLLTTVLRKISVSLLEALNVFTVVVILIGLMKGEMTGAFTGMACGLIIDSFSLGVFGIAGVANTLTGYLSGSISKKVNVVPFLPNLVFFGIMASLELAVWMGMSSFIFGEGIPIGKGLIFLQPAFAAIAGSLLYLGIRKFKAKHEK